ncbi:MAG TPA: efflux RND transporter permease subunit, partial [Candidatus Polarisedimenticolaceae bacterium]|nr:efflux RND transporter permease subunit [Candidatus Polarisedimenticolaceae bacterium]
LVGLWPLALATGRENEIWPPFATVMMGGLASSTALTLLVMPVGFVFLRRLDVIFGRLGPWILVGWIGVTSAIVVPLVTQEVLTSLTWQVVTTVLVAGVLLAVAVLVFRRPERPEPAAADGPPAVEVRYLNKTYGRPGPIGRAWRLPEEFAAKVLRAGGRAFDPRSAAARILPLLFAIAGAGYLASALQTMFWRLVFLFSAAVLGAQVFRQLRRARGRADAMGRVEPGGLEGFAATLVPWTVLGWVFWHDWLGPKLADQPRELRLWVPIAIGAVTAICQLGRRSALLQARGTQSDWADTGRLRRVRTVWRRLAKRIFGLDLPREQVRAVVDVHFTARRGMVGVLGPNGAGKTTLLRMLAGILDPTVGVITIGGVKLPKLRRYLARWVGYLPQEFGLPDDLTAREYLDYYALLYEIRPAAARRERVERLLSEVGLAERAGERIGSYSGGMRQRVAVARTLLRLPSIIIVDEPTVGLDPRERIRFRNLLSRLAEGRVVLFSTHVVEDVAVACERVLVMARGRVVFDGPPPDLAAQAEGRVWEASLDPGTDTQLPEGAMLVDQVPEESGRLRSRILAASRPMENAAPTDPSLEDGYLWLVNRGAPA